MIARTWVVEQNRSMKNTMYLTKADADAKGLPSVQEQIDRWNQAMDQIAKERVARKEQ